MPPYTSKNRVLNVPEFWMSLMQYIRWLYRLQCSYQDRDLFRTLSSIQDVAVCKKNNAWVQVHNQNCFRARGGGGDTLKTTFWMENLTQRYIQSRPFFQTSGHFFRFSKRAREAVSVAEYAPISLNKVWLC